MKPLRPALVCAGCVAATVHGALRAPYAPDAATLHLYHFEQAAGSLSSPNQGSRGSSIYAVQVGTATATPASAGSVLGVAGAAGFGNAASLTIAGDLLGYDANAPAGFRPDVTNTSLSTDQIALSTLNISSGSAFTIEALIRPGSATGNRHILSTDSSAATRGFQFRLSTSGAAQVLDFNIVGTGQQVTATIPSTGPHAFATGTWFHVAFVHDGSGGQFFWTALNATYTTAQPLGSRQAYTVAAAASSIQGPLVIGNENRNNAGESFAGLIDQVRISSIARSPSDFVFTFTDTDSDGLPDDWELLYFPNLNQGPLDDPDNDLANNLLEYQNGSNPNRASNPNDLDEDDLPDSWEQANFGSLSQGRDADTDGDGASNFAEFNAGSAPQNRASTPDDVDGDELPDAWELLHFGTLQHNGGGDPDNDHFSNLQEQLAATLPSHPASRPAGTAVRLVPVDDGNNTTSEYGYAGSSAINTVAFVRSSLKTVGSQQFLTYYGRHRFDPSGVRNNTIWIARRTLGSSEWEVFRHPTYTANTITDGHDVISFGIDGDGYMHLSWGMHGDAFHYARSTTPVTGSGPIELGPDTTMTGREATVTYPQFLLLPDGDLLYLFREGYSGNGNTYLNRYDTATKTWSNVHTDSNGNQAPFIRGMWAPLRDYNPYVNMPQLGGPDGDDLILTYNWRYLPVNGTGSPGSPGGFSGYQTNNMLNFARSTDAGVTWQKFDGTPHALPISMLAESGNEATRAEVIVNIPEGSSLINQASTCIDRAGNPVTATWWAPETSTGNYRRQYMVVFRHANGTWQTRAVSSRTRDPVGTRYSEAAVRDLGRPIVVCDSDNRIIVVYRDNEGSNGLTVVHSLPLADDPDRLVWTSFDLTTENLGNYEPIIDNELWDRERKLHILHQASEGQGYSAPANLAARMSVLEWDAADYFRHNPDPVLSAPEPGKVRVSWRTEPSFTYSLKTSSNLTDWTDVTSLRGTGSVMEHDHTLAQGENQRFWRIVRTEP